MWRNTGSTQTLLFFLCNMLPVCIYTSQMSFDVVLISMIKKVVKYVFMRINRDTVCLKNETDLYKSSQTPQMTHVSMVFCFKATSKH